MTLVELVDQILAELGFPKSSGVMASQGERFNRSLHWPIALGVILLGTTTGACSCGSTF